MSASEAKVSLLLEAVTMTIFHAHEMIGSIQASIPPKDSLLLFIWFLYNENLLA